VHEWVVGGAIIEAAVLPWAVEWPSDALLLVQNSRRGGLVDWTPPGGVIDSGEAVIAGLTREVEEETGLLVLEWQGPLYEISAVAPDLGWTLRVEVHRAVVVEGLLRTGADPDGIVVGADLVPVGRCEERLLDAHPWVREPLLEWMEHRWAETRAYAYEVVGSDPRELNVRRSA
jgi:8-oxo-dGTP diphosphatase